MRKFTAATNDKRCKADIRYRDGSGAQCMRAAKVGGYCIQHSAIVESIQECYVQFGHNRLNKKELQFLRDNVRNITARGFEAAGSAS